MANTKKRVNFFETEEGLQVEQTLKMMETDSAFNTSAGYSANGMTYPDHVIPFVDKHMKYLNEHQNVNIEHYLANLRLMTRVR